MAGPIKKTVQIDVDSKDLKNALKLIEQIAKSQQSVLKVLQKVNEVEKKHISSLKEEQRAISSIINEQRKRYDLEKKLSDFDSQVRRRQLETPKMSFLEQVQKYKGAAGGFTRLGEAAQARGQLKIDAFDRQLIEQQAKRAELEEKYQAARATGDGRKTRGALIQLRKQDAAIQQTEESKSKAIGETKTQVNKYAALAQAAQKVSAVFERVGKAALDFVIAPFKKLADKTMEAVTAMFNFSSGIATFATSTSLVTNAAARESQLKYGLTEAQNYGFTKAKEMLNIQSDEDLMYMNSEQRERLLSYMENYTNWFDDMRNSGVLQNIQEMQLEFNELKEELAMEFLSWVAENKETLMTCIKGIFEVIKAIANFVMQIVTLFGGKGTNYDLYNAASASDNINNNNNSKNTQINMNINTTNNATGVLGSQEALNQFNEQNWEELSKQIVSAIGG